MQIHILDTCCPLLAQNLVVAAYSSPNDELEF